MFNATLQDSQKKFQESENILQYPHNYMYVYINLNASKYLFNSKEIMFTIEQYQFKDVYLTI